MITIREDEEESGSQATDTITKDKLSIVKEVKESFGYWQDKDMETTNHSILHILRHTFGRIKKKEAHIP